MNSFFKILLVDDSVDNLKEMVSIFKEYCPKYDIYQTNNPASAVELAKAIKPHLIITDWEMPDVSGIQLVKKLKSEERTKEIPIIMDTGIMLSSEYLQTALEAGAIDYIRKPIDKIELIARVRSVLELDSYKKQIIETKNIELTENTLFLVRNNSFNIKIKNQLTKLNTSTTNKLIVRKIIGKIDEKIQTDSWYRFELAFSSVHNDFKVNLINKFPKLTPTEIKLCLLLKLDLSNKDIAIAMVQTDESIRVARTRLRKKLELPVATNLLSFFSNI